MAPLVCFYVREDAVSVISALSLFLGGFIVRELYGNSTGIVRGRLPLDFYNLLIDLFVFLVGGDAAHDKSRKIGRQASRHVGTGRDTLYHLRTRTDPLNLP